MLKLLLLAVVIGVVWWMMSARRRPPGAPKPPPPSTGSAGSSKTNRTDKTAPAPMLACAHCGVHLPKTEVVFDAGGQSFCTDAHRLAGPR